MLSKREYARERGRMIRERIRREERGRLERQDARRQFSVGFFATIFVGLVFFGVGIGVLKAVEIVWSGAFSAQVQR